MALQSSGYKQRLFFKRALKLTLFKKKQHLVKVTEKEVKDAYKNAKPEFKTRYFCCRRKQQKK